MHKFALLTPTLFVKGIFEGEGDPQELEALYTAHFGQPVKHIPIGQVAKVGPGHLYRPDLNFFVPKQPYDSWNFNESTLEWEAPEPVPENMDAGYSWDEALGRWVHISEYTLENIFEGAKNQGMPFTASDGNTYHMQARDKDRTNVTGLYLGARDFQTSGDMIQFTPLEDVPAVTIERDIFVYQIVPQYLYYFSALHFARKLTQQDISLDKTINVQETFDQHLQQKLTNPQT